MRKSLSAVLLASALALPAGAQVEVFQGILVEPQNPTANDRLQLTVVGQEPLGCPLEFRAPFLSADDTVLLRASFGDCVPGTPIYKPFRRAFEIAPLPAGPNSVEVRMDHLPGLTWRELIMVGEDTAHLDLGENDRFEVLVRWSNPKDGTSGTGHARRLAQDSGAFWFFTPDNLEVTIKILDGRAVNGFWWVFIASMTDLQLEIETRQRGAAPGAYANKTYRHDAGRNRNTIDTTAFGDAPPLPPVEAVLTTPEIVIDPERPTPADPIHVEVAVLNTEPDIAFTEVEGHSIFFDFFSYGYPADRPLPPFQRFTAEKTVGPLLPGIYTVDVRLDSRHGFGRTFEVSEPLGQLHLQDTADSYFNVYVNLDSPQGGIGGIGYGVPLTRESGYFWFFDPDNIELTVKILDGRAVNGKYWVFIASMTDVAYTVEVERCISHSDPFGCGSVFYRSVQGVNQNVIDVDFVGNLK
jgi:hypothetical protein